MKISLSNNLAASCGLALALTVSACGPAPSPDSASPKSILFGNHSQPELMPAINEDTFNQIADLAFKFHKDQIKAAGDIFTLYKLWKNDTVSSKASRNPENHKTYVALYGGFARGKNIVPEAFALVACHEFSHLYAGPPYYRGYERLSAEGNCDYVGAGPCLHFVLDSLPSSVDVAHESSGTIRERCSMYPANTTAYSHCVRGMNGAISLTSLLSTLNEEHSAPRLETPDPTVVQETELSYPKTVQCRLDTISNALLGKPRPLCWFNPNQPLVR